MKQTFRCGHALHRSGVEGFTLIEVIIASAVAVVVGALVVGILVNNTGLFYSQSSAVDEGVSLNDALGQITSAVKQAAQVASGYPASSPTYITGASTLVLMLPSLGSSGVIANTYDYVVISPDSANPKVLRLQIFPDAQSTRKSANTVLTTILSSIQFSYPDKNGVATTPASAVSVGINLAVLSKTGTIGGVRTSNTVVNLLNM